MTQTPNRSYAVNVEVDGTHYTGSYSVQGRIVTVTDGKNERSRQLGGVSAEVLAMNLLREMIKGGNQ